ncbi:Uncharacterized protein TCM_035489 [Theobroma cacao]|uniref:Uncharacterized protein n=1 Tax=Theobroma cacao TaxID=3641 RepID=A0A061FJ56_THECC|nr:Uncharacterized protein TCM_035489 [Theobroma cacao]
MIDFPLNRSTDASPGAGRLSRRPLAPHRTSLRWLPRSALPLPKSVGLYALGFWSSVVPPLPCQTRIFRVWQGNSIFTYSSLFFSPNHKLTSATATADKPAIADKPATADKLDKLTSVTATVDKPATADKLSLSRPRRCSLRERSPKIQKRKLSQPDEEIMTDKQNKVDGCSSKSITGFSSLSEVSYKQRKRRVDLLVFTLSLLPISSFSCKENLPVFKAKCSHSGVKTKRNGGIMKWYKVVLDLGK